MARINVQLEVDGPVTEMDEADLVRTDSVVDDDNEFTRITEYRLPGADPKGRAIHRSVHVHLKKPFAEGISAIGKF